MGAYQNKVYACKSIIPARLDDLANAPHPAGFVDEKKRRVRANREGNFGERLIIKRAGYPVVEPARSRAAAFAAAAAKTCASGNALVQAHFKPGQVVHTFGEGGVCLGEGVVLKVNAGGITLHNQTSSASFTYVQAVTGAGQGPE